METLERPDTLIQRRPVPEFVWPEATDLNSGLDWEATVDCLERFIVSLQALMVKHSYAALAANQVGANANVFVLNPLQYGSSRHTVYVNPKVVVQPGPRVAKFEDSPNYPGMLVRVERPTECTIAASTTKGDKIVVSFDCFWTRHVLQAMDSLNGTTLLDRSCIQKHGYSGEYGLNLRIQSFDAIGTET